MWSQRDDEKKNRRPSLSSQKGAEVVQVAQVKKKEEKLKENRLERVEMENKQIEALKSKIIANMDKMSWTGEINNSNVAEYYEQANQGISPEEIQAALKIKADRLVPLWWKTI